MFLLQTGACASCPNGQGGTPQSNDAALTADGRMVTFSVYTAGYLEAVDEIIRASSPQKIEEYEDMQELEIAFSFDSPNVTLDDIKLLLLIKHPDLEYLLNHSEGRVECEESSGITKGILHYVGDYAYDGESELLGHSTSELGCTVTVLQEISKNSIRLVFHNHDLLF